MKLQRRFRAKGGQFSAWRPYHAHENSAIAELFSTDTLAVARFTAEDGSTVEYRRQKH